MSVPDFHTFPTSLHFTDIPECGRVQVSHRCEVRKWVSRAEGRVAGSFSTIFGMWAAAGGRREPGRVRGWDTRSRSHSETRSARTERRRKRSSERRKVTRLELKKWKSATEAVSLFLFRYTWRKQSSFNFFSPVKKQKHASHRQTGEILSSCLCAAVRVKKKDVYWTFTDVYLGYKHL